MQNTDFNQKPITKSTKKLYIIILAVALILVGLTIIMYLILGKDNNEQQNIQVEQNQIIESDLLETKNIDSNGVSFIIPGGYNSEESDNGVYIITNKDDEEESVIIINTTNAKDSNLGYEDVVLNESSKLIDKIEKEIPNGIKMFGILDTTPTLISILKTTNGVVVIKSSGDTITEAIFDAITSSVEDN